MNKVQQEIAAASLGALTRDENGSFQGRYLFPENFSGFAGHFPGHPILPAIVEIMTVIHLAGEYLGCRQRLIGVEDAKFLTPVLPNQELLVRCRPRTVRGKPLYDAQLSVEGIITASVLIELACAKELP
jgi:3-hydroxyacyl-[acyl-carrier-protein] dehydratase